MKKQAIKPFYSETGIYDIGDIARSSSGHFFSANAMRFFKSRLVDEVFPSRGRVYFVTSEKFDVETKSIKTVGEFQAYSTRTQALSAALNYAYDNLKSNDR